MLQSYPIYPAPGALETFVFSIFQSLVFSAAFSLACLSIVFAILWVKIYKHRRDKETIWMPLAAFLTILAFITSIITMTRILIH